MKHMFTVNIPPDFYILCDLFSLKPEEVLQYYVNHISLPMFVDVSLDNPFGAATFFFMQYSHDDEEV